MSEYVWGSYTGMTDAELKLLKNMKTTTDPLKAFLDKKFAELAPKGAVTPLELGRLQSSRLMGSVSSNSAAVLTNTAASDRGAASVYRAYRDGERILMANAAKFTAASEKLAANRADLAWGLVGAGGGGIAATGSKSILGSFGSKIANLLPKRSVYSQSYAQAYSDMAGGAAAAKSGIFGGALKWGGRAAALGALVGGVSMYGGSELPEAGRVKTGGEILKSVWPLGRAAGQGMFIGEEAAQAAGMSFYMSQQAKSVEGMQMAHGAMGERVGFMKTAIDTAKKVGSTEVEIKAYEEFLKSMENAYAIQEKQLEFYSQVKPKISEYNTELEKETKLHAQQTEQLGKLEAEQRAIPGQISDYGAKRFGVGATIGGVTVGSELGGMEQMWMLQKEMLTAKKAQLESPDVYGQYKQMSATERLAGLQAGVGLASANLGYVSAAEGTAAKDRALVAVQKLRAEEQMRSATADLQIEQEKQRAAASDTAGAAYEEASRKLQIASIDMQLSYGDMHKQVEFFIMKHEDMADKVPATVKTVEESIKGLWKRQKELDDEIPNMARKMDESQDSIDAYKAFLRDLNDNGVAYLNRGLEDLKRNLRDIQNGGPNFRNFESDRMSIDYSLSENS